MSGDSNSQQNGRMSLKPFMFKTVTSKLHTPPKRQMCALHNFQHVITLQSLLTDCVHRSSRSPLNYLSNVHCGAPSGCTNMRLKQIRAFKEVSDLFLEGTHIYIYIEIYMYRMRDVLDYVMGTCVLSKSCNLTHTMNENHVEP